MTHRRTRRIFARTLLALAAAALTAAAHAAVPDRIGFQGRLLDSSKNPRNGSFDMTFRICDTEAGSCASPVWTETQTGVVVTNGAFSVQLGSVSALGQSVFADAARYLEIEVEAETLTPRQRLAASGYAFRAAFSDDLAAGDTDYIQARGTLQSGATFYVSSATVAGDLAVGDALTVGGLITAGSGANVITTAAGLLDASKSTNTLPNSSIDTSSVTKQGNTFNVADRLVLLDASGHLNAPARVAATSGVEGSSGTFTGPITASSASLTATGAATYSLVTSSGVNVQAGTLTAGGDVNSAGNVTAAGDLAAANFNLVFLASTSLNSAGGTISVSFSAHRVLVAYLFFPSATLTGIAGVQFNGDTGNNYASSRADAFAAPTAGTNASNIALAEANSGTNAHYYHMTIYNLSTSRKMLNSEGLSDGGAPGTAPTARDAKGVWNNTSSNITQITCMRSAGNYAAGTTLTVFGVQ
jgi:hypothetical protein